METHYCARQQWVHGLWVEMHFCTQQQDASQSIKDILYESAWIQKKNSTCGRLWKIWERNTGPTVWHRRTHDEPRFVIPLLVESYETARNVEASHCAAQDTTIEALPVIPMWLYWTWGLLHEPRRVELILKGTWCIWCVTEVERDLFEWPQGMQVTMEWRFSIQSHLATDTQVL